MVVLSNEKKRELIVFLRILANAIGAVALVAVLASCGTSPGYSYTIGGTVSGMVGSGMVLQNNGGDDLKITGDGSFVFATALTDGAAYNVTVQTHPTNPSQTCSVSNGSSAVNGAPVYNVVVSCVNGPTSVTVNPNLSRPFVYATNTDGSISAYQINPDGTLTPGTTLTGMTYPVSVTVDPSGEFAYAVDTIGGLIWVYSIDSIDGNLTYVENVPAGAYPSSIVTVLLGSLEFAYVTNMGDNTISAYTIQNDGTLVELANSPFQAGTSPSSIVTVLLGSLEFAYVTNMSDSTIWSYSLLSDGNLVFSGELSTGTYPSSVTVDQSGQFVYVVNESSNSISVYAIDQTDGTLTAVTSVAAGTYPTSIITVKLPVGEFAYVTNTGDNTISVYTIDTTDGTLTALGTPVAAGAYPSSIAIDNPLNGKFAYVANMGGGTILVFKINPDGTLVLISP